ncbi:3'-5' exonuclease [Methanomethylophilus alvi]|uniref:3'-5' exonuclease n=1 Tax=Methanomethylophilus alvi TaxID=1291540 RepID=UPI0037DC17AF
MVLIIDTETTGLSGYPKDRVLEIGIAELEGGSVRPVYSEIIRYPDIAEFDRKYVNPDGSEGIWIYRNTDLRMEDTLNTAKDAEAVATEVRGIVSGREVTSYNVEFDFGKFMYHEPWNLKDTCSVPFDILDLATERVYFLAEDDLIQDKMLQERLLREREESYYPEKWVRSIDAYRALCPEDPMGLEGMRHRAIDDAVMEGWILKALQINNTDFLG